MTTLEDVVALLDRSEPRCTTLQVVGREWRHNALLREAFTATVPPGALVATAVRASGEPESAESEGTWRWWSQAPDLLRAEFAVGEDTVTVWSRGTTWWSWSPSQGARTNESRWSVGHGKGPGEIMVLPGQTAHVLHLELLEPLTVLTRPAYRLRARRPNQGDLDLRARDQADAVLYALGQGADEYELVVDAQHGFLLRTQAKFAGKTFRTLEMTKVVVDADLPASLFTPRAPEGEHFEYFEPTRRLSLEELPGAVPFKVFVPAKAPRRPDLVELRNPEPRRGIQLSAIISYFIPNSEGKHGNLWIHESVRAEQTMPQPPEGWRQVDSFMVCADETMGHLRCKLVLEREGTHIHLESTALGVRELIDLARSLVPLSSGRPK